MSKKEVTKLQVLKMDDSQCLVESMLKRLQDDTDRGSQPTKTTQMSCTKSRPFFRAKIISVRDILT
jgi:hypothetical protein